MRTVWPVVDGEKTRCRAAPAGYEVGNEASPRMPLLLLHGLGCSSDAWTPSLRVLAGRGLPQPAYAPDFPGCGRTRNAGGALDMDELGDWTARLMDVLEIERAHVAGNSLGCQAALALARRHPARVGGLALLGPTTGPALESFWRYALGLLLDGLVEPPAYNLTLLKMYAQMGLPRYVATLRHMMADDPLAQIDRVQAPCLVLRGGKDGIVPERAARELAAALPRGEYRELDSTAHAAGFNTPELFADATLKFLAHAEREMREADRELLAGG
ncbi:MAG: alpha/beta hydrolase [Armatimonadetes bacterium]|nr:alpha/beta hydrolase [Armatimonadota bacterium]